MVRRRTLLLPSGYPARDATTYETFRVQLESSGCDLCPLSAARTRIVVDRGDPKARVLLVGEGPGAEEDRTGQAFVGRGGKLLDAMLEEAGIDPGRDILIANIVKCRPPKNRPPTPEEAARCLPFLRRQIELVEPRLIGLFGATAVRTILGAGAAFRMSERVGRFFLTPELGSIEIMALFHPAYVLRDPRKRPETVRHLQDLRARSSELERERIALN